MKKNIGNADRIIRAFVGVVFAFLVLSGAVMEVLSLVLGMISGVFLLTSVSGFCPLYYALGIRTSSPDHHHSH